MDDNSLYIVNFGLSSITAVVSPPPAAGVAVEMSVGPQSFAQVATQTGLPGRHPITARRPWTVGTRPSRPNPPVVNRLPAIVGLNVITALYSPPTG